MMDFINGNLLSLITFSPLIGAAIVAALPKNRVRLIRWMGFSITLIPLALAVLLWIRFVPDRPGYQFEQIVPVLCLKLHLLAPALLNQQRHDVLHHFGERTGERATARWRMSAAAELKGQVANVEARLGAEAALHDGPACFIALFGEDGAHVRFFH